ncbi:MAG: FkbM family methyltransferase [Dysgonamonadaceae bacterium]|jgi:FkbM family methyltransferase|nr:FkbM family methyltransferase [Dysgonamonadaceae bacterium]
MNTKVNSTNLINVLKRVARALGLSENLKTAVWRLMAFRSIRKYKKLWLREENGEKYFDINGAKLPDLSDSPYYVTGLLLAFEDVYTIPYFYNDDYSKSNVEKVDSYLIEGPYGYRDEAFDVDVKKGDAVIDAGAWIGDFSAYAANKGATVYAFEPVESTYQILCKTQAMNNTAGKIVPVAKGLSDREMHVDIAISENKSGSNSTIITDSSHNSSETITLTTIDRFAEENKLERVDFIKADIEGAERECFAAQQMFCGLLRRNLQSAPIICPTTRKSWSKLSRKPIRNIKLFTHDTSYLQR